MKLTIDGFRNGFVQPHALGIMGSTQSVFQVTHVTIQPARSNYHRLTGASELFWRCPIHLQPLELMNGLFEGPNALLKV